MIKTRAGKLTSLQPESLEQRLFLTANAQLVLDANAEDVGVNPSFVTAFKEEIYFAANVGDTPEAEIWKSDGTVGGTQFVATLGFGQVVRMEAFQDQLLIVIEIAGDHRDSTTGLFATDGTQQGTVELVRTLDAANPFSESLSSIVISGNHAHVRAGAFVDNTRENFHTVYSIDATANVVQQDNIFAPASSQDLLKLPLLPDSDEVDLAAFATYHPNLSEGLLAPATRPAPPTLVNDRLFFAASGTDTGKELWELDRTGVSQLVVDLHPGTDSSSPTQLTEHNGHLFFLANNEQGKGVWVLPSGSSSPQRLADADGATKLTSTEDAVLFTNAFEEPDSLQVSHTDSSFDVSIVGTIPADHDNLNWFKESLVYTRPTDNGQVLERLTEDGLTTVEIGDTPDEFLIQDSILFFTSSTTSGRELWTFDGTEATEIDTPFRSGSITTDFEITNYFSTVTTELAPNGSAVLG